MLAAEDKARREAMGWLIMLRDPATADWVAFTQWLEADPANNQAYEAAALADDALAATLAGGVSSSSGALSSNDNEAIAAPPRRRLFAWSAGAAAAILAVAVAVPMLQEQPQPYVIATAAGEHRTVTLEDGTRIQLNGDSRLGLDRGTARIASLERGEAAFTVVHDAAHPFVVRIGEHEVQDVGTVFNIARSPDAIEVAVAEGSVLFNPSREAVALTAGQSLRLEARTRRAVVATTDPASVGSWRNGRLVYSNAPLSRVAADLSRNLGIQVEAAPAMASRPFSGVILLDGEQGTLMARVGALVDARMERRGATWLIAPGRDGAN